MRPTFYVMGILGGPDGLTIIEVRSAGESPWEITRNLRQEWVILYQATADTFTQARQFALDGYPEAVPSVAKRFPLDDRGEPA